MTQAHASTAPEPQSAVPPQNPTATHPYRVYGYRATREWVYEFAKNHGISDQEEGSLEGAVFGHLTLRLPGLEFHFLDDPSDTDFGYCHCLAIANNWNQKKLARVASRLPKWKSVLGTEEKPQWYTPTHETVPRRSVAALPSRLNDIDGHFLGTALESRSANVLVRYQSSNRFVCAGDPYE